MAPDRRPGCNSSRLGRPAVTARAASTTVTRSLMVRTPRRLPAVRLAIAVSMTATTASATSASIRVKPAAARRGLRPVRRDNFDSSRQPVYAHLVAQIVAAERDDAAARNARGEEADGGAGRAFVAARRQQRPQRHVGRKVNGASRGARAQRT